MPGEPHLSTQQLEFHNVPHSLADLHGIDRDFRNRVAVVDGAANGTVKRGAGVDDTGVQFVVYTIEEGLTRSEARPEISVCQTVVRGRGPKVHMVKI